MKKKVASDRVNRWIEVTAEEAVAGCRALAAQGLFVGPSSGACYVAARRLAAEGRHGTLATVFADSGERYASTGMWAGEAVTAETSSAATRT